MSGNQSRLFFLFAFFSLFLGLLFISSSGVQAAEEPLVKINGGERTTRTRRVTLTVIPPETGRDMRVSNLADFFGARWEPVTREKEWTLDFGGGTKVVYVQFRDNLGTISQIYRASINLSVPQGIQADFTINNAATSTSARYVTLRFTYGAGVELVALSNTNSFEGTVFQPIQQTMQWILSPVSGTKTVYARFKSANGEVYTVTRSILYTQPTRYIEERSVIRGANDSVYYVGFDGRLHPFIHSVVYHSFYPNFSNIQFVGTQKLREYLVGQPVCIRQGTWLLKFKGFPAVYAVESGCVLRPLLSEAEAFILYGPSWAKRIVELDPVHQAFYQVRFATQEPLDKDRDRDGISRETEIRYGTSDGSADSDGDKLSDYEEAIYWFTDPTKSDTDGDGVGDGTEIMQGTNPSGVGALTTIPEGTYVYPDGSVIYRWWQDKRYYYSHPEGYMYLADTYSTHAFIENDFQPLFVITPPYPIEFEHTFDWRKLNENVYITNPLTHVYSVLTPL